MRKGHVKQLLTTQTNPTNFQNISCISDDFSFFHFILI